METFRTGESSEIGVLMKKCPFRNGVFFSYTYLLSDFIHTWHIERTIGT